MTWATGNANLDGQPSGWFVGAFVKDESSLRHTQDVEIKWRHHEKGEQQAEWEDSEGTSVSVLVSGQFRIIFESGQSDLLQQGDYAIWAPGVPHRSVALDDSVILTVRWPSIPSDD